ncbi:MAG: DUF2812 domain-containing protein [Lachnospiraceae bacterium]
MRNVKYCINNYMLYDYVNVEKHLMKMAEKGWRLEKISRIFWKYRRAAPASVTYAITYLPEASRFDPDPTEEEMNLIAYCQEAGWEKIADWEQMQVFCNERETPVPIETDERIRLDIIKKSMGKSIWAYWLIIVLYFIPLGMKVSEVLKYPMQMLSENYNLFLIVLLLYLELQFGCVLAKYYYWVRMSEKSVNSGGACLHFSPQKCLKMLNWMMWLLLTVGMILLFNPGMRGQFLIMLGGLMILYSLSGGLEKLLKYLKAPGELNKFMVIAFYAVLYIVMSGVLTSSFIKYRWFEKKPVSVYETAGWEWDIYADEIPLKIEDLVETDYGHYSYEKDTGESVFMKQEKYSQQSFPDGEEAYDLYYTVTDVKTAFLYDWMVDSNRKSNVRFYNENAEYKEIDVPEWNADRVFRYFYSENMPGNWWMICVGNRIIELRADWDFTEEQIRIITEKLYPADRG